MKVVALGTMVHACLVGLGVVVSEVVRHPSEWGPSTRDDHMNLWEVFK